MTAETLLRLALVPAAVWLSSIAARRWGHTVSGYLGGLPMIGGPITLFLAIDYGAAFAARAALFTLGAVVAQGAYLLVMATVGQKRGWLAALASGWATFVVVAVAVSFVPLSPALALLLAIAGLAAAWRWLPDPPPDSTRPAVPAVELRLRLAAAFVLAVVILASAPLFGPVVSGVLLSMPVTGSITPPFTRAMYGPVALARLVRGFVVGLSAFTTFFFVIATAAVPWGIGISFVAAVLAALAAVFIVQRLLRRT